MADKPTIVENILETFYYVVANRFAAITEAGDVGLNPNELFMTPDELRDKLSQLSRLELRTLGRTAAETNEALLLDSKVDNTDAKNAREIGRKSGSTTPLFLFPAAEKSVDIEIQSRSTRNFHGDFQAFVSDLFSRHQRESR